MTLDLAIESQKTQATKEKKIIKTKTSVHRRTYQEITKTHIKWEKIFVKHIPNKMLYPEHI